MCVCVCERERERERERMKKHRAPETDRGQTDRHTDRDTQSERWRKAKTE